MKIVKLLGIVFLVVCSGQLLGTNLYLLNKTGGPLYYEYFYYSFWKPLGNPDLKEGWLDNNESKMLSSYRFVVLELRPKRFMKDPIFVNPLDPKSFISSIAGDQRILNKCNMGECDGKMLKNMKATLRQGELVGDQGILHLHLVYPVVLVVTLDPVAQKMGQIKYIITELSSSYAGKVSFLNRLKALQLPDVEPIIAQ